MRRTGSIVVGLAALLLALGVAVSLRASGTAGPSSSPAPARQGSEGLVPLGSLPLTVEPAPVPQGGQVQLAARGFLPGEPVVIRAAAKANDPNAMVLQQLPAGPQGTLDAVAVALPEELTSGAHALEAVGQKSGRRSAGVLWIRAREPWIVLGSNDLKPQQDWGLVAGGFAAEERALVSLEPRRAGAGGAQEQAKPAGSQGASPERAAPAGPVELAALPTDRVGNSEWFQLKLPIIRPGAYTLVVRGESGGQELRRDVTVKPFEPVIELSPWAGPPGTKIEMNARGFAAGETVRVLVGTDSREAARLTADGEGNFWGAGPARVPYDVAPGTLAVTFKGEASGTAVAAQFKVLEPKPWLELTAWYGPPSAPVGFTGGGWAAGERISFHMGSAASPPVAVGQADDHGWLRFGGPVYIPGGTGDSVTFVAVGEQSHAQAVATFKVVVPFGLGR